MGTQHPGAQAGAIGWLVELRSGEATPADHEAFAAWLAADAAHRDAWQRLTGALDHTFASASPLPRGGAARAVEHTLARASTLAHQRRRVLRGALGVAGLGVAAGWVGRSQGLLPDLMADLHTATAERRAYPLWGGGSVLLDARSSADLDGNVPQVALRAGQLIASQRSAGPVPWRLHSAQVDVEMRQGRCLMKTGAAHTLVCPLDGEVAVTPRAGGAPGTVLQAGQAAWIDRAGGRMPVDPADIPLLATWERGVLAVRDGSLGEVVARLQPYRHGLLRIADEAAALRLSGTYPLDDTDAALQALAETLPIAVRRYTGGWLVRIERSA